MATSSFYARMGRLSAIVMILPSSMAGGWLLGYYGVDHFLDSFPWGSMGAALLGAGAGFYEILRILARDSDERGSHKSRRQG